MINFDESFIRAFAISIHFQDIALLLLRVLTGFAFCLHGWPKIRQPVRWANSLGFPIWLCCVSALTMLLGGMGLIVGFLTTIDSTMILVSMLTAVVLKVSKGLPFIGTDPHLLAVNEYQGPLGPGEEPSYEKALLYVSIVILFICIGPGFISLDRIIANFY